ncbi:MAG: hypothetical protein J5940_01670, partial [Clostridia bacterium]|nr:hypothetical protein [Clostridia bacterium]
PNCGTSAAPVPEQPAPEQPGTEQPAPEQPGTEQSAPGDAVVPAEETGAEETPKKKRTRRPPAPKPVEERRISDNITLFSDGKYRWKYDLNLFTNPTVFFVVWKIFFFIILIMVFIGCLFQLGDGDFFWDGFKTMMGVFGIAVGVMTGVSLLGYLVYAAIMGGKYRVEFEMDEYGLTHTQVAEQAKKAKKISALTMLAGAAARRPTVVTAGYLSSAKTRSVTDFSKVRKVKVNRTLRVIKLNELIEHNQVYAAKEDFPFVESFILEHCTNTKKYKREHPEN